MPIRFRCAYCNQLLGIARRKSGTIVRCPTCAGQIIVPKSLGTEEQEEAEKKNGTGLFEQSDFEDVFRAGPEPSGSQANEILSSSESSPVAAPAIDPPVGAWGTHPEPAYDMERLPFAPVQIPKAMPTVGPTGWHFTKRQLLVIGVGIFCAVSLAFVGGLWLGYMLWHASASAP